MSLQGSCPSNEQWQEHLKGTLSQELQAELTSHLDQCESCQQTLEKLASGSGSWKGLTGEKIQKTFCQEPALQQVLEQLKEKKEGVKSAAEDAIRGMETQDFMEVSDNPECIGRLDNYHILEKVGQGGFGIVFRAFDSKLHRVVAIKVLSPELAANGSARQRFIREARTAASVSHENLVTIHGVEEEHSPPYLVMQFIEGVSLEEKLNRVGQLGIKEILRIGLQIAEGLAVAHRHGLVHRDIKPSNILLENGVERVKITDFGLARAVDDATVTQSGVIAGTPMYMSPEQASGEAIDHRSDLFSLGTVLYEMCTGRPPFRAAGTMAVMRRVCDETPRPIREINPDIPDWLCDIISKLHAKKPENRFQTAREVADLLGQHLAHLQQPGIQPMPAPVRVEPEIPAAWEPPATTTWASKLDPQKRQLLHTVASLALLVALVALWIPVSWETVSPAPGELSGEELSIINWELGVLRPLRLTWETSDRGFWLRFSAIRAFPLFLTVTLSISAAAMALRNYRLARRIRRQLSQSEKVSSSQTLNAQVGKSFRKFVLAASLILVISLITVIIFTGPGLIRYLGDYGTLALDGYDLALEQVTVRQGDTVVAILTQPWDSPIHLPSGKYELEFVCKPGFQVGNIFLDHTRYFEGFPPNLITQFKSNTGHSGPGTSRFYSLPIESGEYIRLIPSLEKVPLGSPKPSEKPKEGEWFQLFNSKDLSGWKSSGTPFPVDIANGQILANRQGYMQLDRVMPTDYLLRFETQLTRGQVDVSFWFKPNSKTGWRLLLAETNNKSGPVMVEATLFANVEGKSLKSTKTAATTVMLGDWFAVEIIAHGQKAEVHINGVKLLDLQHEDFRPEPGTIGLSVSPFQPSVLMPGIDRYGKSPQAVFRKIEIKELPAEDDFLRDLIMMIRAGTGEMTPPEEAGLMIQNHPLLLQLADPNTKPLIGLLAQLPDSCHKELIEKGYLKWKFADLDPARQRVYRNHIKYVLDTFNKLQTDIPKHLSKENLEFADVGFLVFTPQSGGQKTLSLYILFGDHPLPLWKVLVGGKAIGVSDLYSLHEKQALPLRKQPYSPLPPAIQPFVLLVKDTKGEQTFATLPEAVKVAKSGDTIEIRDNGPFLLPPLDLGNKKLLIRAGTGFRPIFELDTKKYAGQEGLFNFQSLLILEGLELRIDSTAIGNCPLVNSLEPSSTLILRHCRLVNLALAPAVNIFSHHIEIYNTEMITPRGTVVSWPFPSKGTALIDQSVLFGNKGLTLHVQTNPFENVSLRVNNSTVLGTTFGFKVLWWKSAHPLDTNTPSKLLVDTSGNVIYGKRGLLDLVLAETKGKLLSLNPKDTQDFFASWRWNGENNLLGPARPFLYVADKIAFPQGNPVRIPEDWKAFWNSNSIPGIAGEPLFQSQDLMSFSPDSPGSLTAADFRLSPGSPGNGAGANGKDMGANVDLVGPGQAYEAWQKTAEYQEWRKKAGELIGGGA